MILKSRSSSVRKPDGYGATKKVFDAKKSPRHIVEVIFYVHNTSPVTAVTGEVLSLSSIHFY